MTPCEFHEKMLELQKKMSCPEERHIAMDELMTADAGLGSRIRERRTPC